MAGSQTPSRYLSNRTLGLALVLLGALYVGRAWTPSSYSLALSQLGVENAKPDFGKPRPIRSDEWVTYTPLVQISVNNKLERFNKTSPYQEDLRTFYLLPLADWGRLFKPTMCLFGISSDAVAYSFHWFAMMALFLVGYMLLFERAGLQREQAAAGAAMLFLTAFTQHWWTTNCGCLALFPWVCLVPTSPFPLWARALGTYWIVATWLIDLFYPPLFIPLAAVGITLIISFGWLKSRWQEWAALGIAGIAGAVTALFYLRGYLLATLPTVYPGQRRVGGGAVSWQYFAQEFFPYAFMDHHETTMHTNVCEASVVGSYYLLLVLCFLDYGKAKKAFWLSIAPLLVLLSLMLGWEYLPLPSWSGAILLWNFVPPHRMLYASGLVVLLVALLSASKLGLRISSGRIAAYLGCLLVGWIFLFWPQIPRDRNRLWLELVAVIPAFAAAIFVWSPRLPTDWFHRFVLGFNVVLGAATFGTFNPLQSAKPIFNRPQTPISRMLAGLESEQGGVLAVEGYPGAILNGWGFKSLSHVLPSPQVAYFAKMFPGIPKDELNTAFNRYAHIIPDDARRRPVNLSADSVQVPIPSLCASIRGGVRLLSEIVIPPGAVEVPVDGSIDSITFGDGALSVVGWADGALGLGRDLQVGLVVDEQVGVEQMESMSRFDVASSLGRPESLCDGFNLHASLTKLPAGAVCVLARNDSKTAYGLVARGKDDRERCRAILKARIHAP